MPRGTTFFMSRFAEHSLRAPITAVSLLLVISMAPAAPTPSLRRLVEHCEADGGDGTTGRCGGAQSRYKVKRDRGWLNEHRGGKDARFWK